MKPYGIIEQAIIWNDVDLWSVKSCCIHIQELLIKSFPNMRLIDIADLPEAKVEYGHKYGLTMDRRAIDIQWQLGYYELRYSV